MKKIKKRSVLTVKSSFKEIKVIPEKNLFENGIAKIFSKEPSHLGYKEDIDNIKEEMQEIWRSLRSTLSGQMFRKQ